MPTDWRHEARTLILAGMGHRETARALGLSEDRVRKWAEREQLSKLKAKAQAIVAKSPNVAKVSAGQVLADEMTANGGIGRLAVSRIGARYLPAVAELAEADPLSITPYIEPANQVAAMQVRSNIPGYERQPSSTAAFSLTMNVQPEPKIVEAREVPPIT